MLGRNCPAPSPSRRSASRQGSQTAAGRQRVGQARAALDGENAVVRSRERQLRPPRSQSKPGPASEARRPGAPRRAEDAATAIGSSGARPSAKEKAPPASRQAAP
ncbi:hypothetical protein C8244_06945 [Paracidovorax avenae]|nr:hypothetical protein C8244_06945 [Paracidovorax avenae]